MKNKKNNFYVIAAILMILATLFFIIVFSPGVTSSVFDPIPQSTSDIGSEAVDGAFENPDYSKIEITPENVQAVIRAMARPSEYYCESRSTLSYSGGSKAYPRKRWVSGSRSRVDIISENGTATMSMLYSNENVYIWRSGSARYYSTGAGDFTPDVSQMTMVYEDILNFPQESILAAQYTLHNSIPCIYVKAANPISGYTCEYWVATDSGLLIRGQTLDASGAVIFTVDVSQTIIGPQDSSLFLLPDGSTAE